MADDNSQDYNDYDRLAKNELYETPQVVDDSDSDQSSTDGQSADNEAADNAGDDENSSERKSDTDEGSAVKEPKDWTTGDEPATPAQKSYISTMAVEAKEEVPTELTKAEASETIHKLQQKTGRDDSTERP